MSTIESAARAATGATDGPGVGVGDAPGVGPGPGWEPAGGEGDVVAPGLALVSGEGDAVAPDFGLADGDGEFFGAAITAIGAGVMFGAGELELPPPHAPKTLIIAIARKHLSDDRPFKPLRSPERSLSRQTHRVT